MPDQPEAILVGPILQFLHGSSSCKAIDFSLPASEVIFLEVFAGRATLTAEVRKSLNLQCIAIDHKVKQPRAKITVLDLTRASDQEIFFNLCMHANVAAAHFAPVCGTAKPVSDPCHRATGEAAHLFEV
jgi:hypothetical protein